MPDFGKTANPELVGSVAAAFSKLGPRAERR
jgi:hypothetical protein